MARYGWLILLALLILCSAAVAVGHIDERFDFNAAMEMWGDLFRDVDRPAYQLSRVSNQEETDLGLKLAAQFPAVPATGWEQYVEQVGARVAAHSTRRGIGYQFHVTTDPFANAWALPGGQIYITVPMLEFLETEAELAAILGHEVAHVDLYHCIEHYQFEIKARSIGVPGAGQLADLAHSLVGATYQQYQELDADAAGVRFASDAGYDPGAAEMVFARMSGARSSVRPEAPLPALGEATVEALGNFLQSHPDNADRRRRLAELVHRNASRLNGRRFYIGRQNYQRRTVGPSQNNAEWINY